MSKSMILPSLILLAALTTDSPAQRAPDSSFSRIGRCQGKTESGIMISATLFQRGNSGIIYLSASQVDGKTPSEYVSFTKVSPTAADGYPRFHSNAFGINAIISDEDPSYSSVYLEGKLLMKNLECSYRPAPISSSGAIR